MTKSTGHNPSVLLIEDHGLCRQGLSELLEKRAGIKTLGATGHPDEVLAILAKSEPELIIMDLSMPEMNGLDLLDLLHNQGFRHIPVVILTMSDAQEDLANVLRAEVRGYLLKDMDPNDIIDALERALKGELVVAPSMTMKLSQLLRPNQPTEPDKQSRLTDRELEILQHLTLGKSNKAIARSLNISHDTVKLHVSHILAKLELNSRVEAAVFAVQNDIKFPEIRERV